MRFDDVTSWNYVNLDDPLSVSRTGKEVTLKAIRARVGWIWLARLFKHSDGGTGGGCTVVLVVLPLVSLIMEATAA